MHSFALGDVNRDGSMDVYASYGNGYNSPDNGNDDILWVNTGNDNHWIAFDLEGIVSNKDAVGTKVVLTGDFGTMIREVRAGESYGITNTFACMFGLGDHEVIETATIKWPSGMETIIENPAIDQYHNLLEAPCMTSVELSYPSNLTLCPGESIEIAATGDFVSYAWSNGSTEPAIMVGEAGTYSVTAYDADGCAAVSDMVVVDIITEAAPQVQVTGDLTFCAGSSVEFIGPNGDGWSWSNGETTQSIVVTESGVYSLALLDACGNENQSEEFAVVVLDAPDVPVVTVPAAIVADEPFILTSSSETTRWFEEELASEPVHVGLTYETSIAENTTLWVEDIADSGMIQAEGGRAEMGDGQYHNNSVRWLVFDAYEDMVIHTVDVFASGAGVREIGISDSDGNVLMSAAFDLVDGLNTITLDMEVAEGTGYGLRSFSDDPQLWRDGTGTEMSYPYELGELGSITQSTAGGNNATNYYYFFYNWVVQTPSVGCASDRVPVTITVVGTTELAVSSLDVYPNPTNGLLQITANQLEPGTQWTLLNALGQTMDQGQLTSLLTTLDLSDMLKGQYVLQVQSKNASQAIQLVVQ